MADWYFRNNKKNSLLVCPGCRNLVRKGEEFCPFCARRLRAEGGARGLVRKFVSSPDGVTRIFLGAMIVMFLGQLAFELLLPAELRQSSGGGLFNLLSVSSYTYVFLGSNFYSFVYFGHEYWRWLTYCFLHIGILHIAFNSWALWDLGRLAQRLWGGTQLFAAFILTGVTGGLGSYLWYALILGRPCNSAGASGAICGIMGLMLGAYCRGRYHLGRHLGSHLVQWTVNILVFGLVMRADNAAHIGGMLGGALMGYFLPPTASTPTPGRDAKIWRVLAWLAAAVAVVCFAFLAHSIVVNLPAFRSGRFLN